MGRSDAARRRRISRSVDLRMPRAFIRALGLIKWAAAGANSELGLLKAGRAVAIQAAALAVAEGRHDDQFPIDVFQTGSGTSSNMNANEVIAPARDQELGDTVHPNDDVNMGQSSNDVIPTPCMSAPRCWSAKNCCQALLTCIETLRAKAAAQKRGEDRAHAPDGCHAGAHEQELGGWAAQISTAQTVSAPRCRACANCPGWHGRGYRYQRASRSSAAKVAVLLSERTGLSVRARRRLFRGAVVPGYGGRAVGPAEDRGRVPDEDRQ